MLFYQQTDLVLLQEFFMAIFLIIFLFLISILATVIIIRIYNIIRLAGSIVKSVEEEDFFPNSVNKIKAGIYANFIEELQKKYGVPRAKLYCFKGWLLVPQAGYFIKEQIATCIFSPFNKNRSIVLISENLLKIFSEDDIKWIICHEIGHINMRDLLFKIGLIHSQKYHMREEFAADEFAARLIGQEQSIATLQNPIKNINKKTR